MTLDDELRLSFYREISEISKDRGISIVQHVESRRLFVRKVRGICEREIYDILAREKFPFIPEIAELVEDGDRLIIIEEYISGESLDEILERGSLSEARVRRLMIQLCDILEPLHAHHPPIVHRDIKPSNLMLSGDQLYLIDFDASRRVEAGQNRDTVLMGTREFAAPEQYGFSQSTPRTDIFSIGVTMNLLLTGNFPAEQSASGSAGSIIARCTQMDPKKRYPNAARLRDALLGRQSSFAPPGFRARKPRFMIPAALWYILIFYVACIMEVNQSDGSPAGPAETAAGRLTVLAVCLIMTLYIGNYRDFLRRFPFRRPRIRDEVTGRLRPGPVLLDLFRVLLGATLICVVPLVINVLIYP